MDVEQELEHHEQRRAAGEDEPRLRAATAHHRQRRLRRQPLDRQIGDDRDAAKQGERAEPAVWRARRGRSTPRPRTPRSPTLMLNHGRNSRSIASSSASPPMIQSSLETLSKLIAPPICRHRHYSGLRRAPAEPLPQPALLHPTALGHLAPRQLQFLTSVRLASRAPAPRAAIRTLRTRFRAPRTRRARRRASGRPPRSPPAG